VNPNTKSTAHRSLSDPESESIDLASERTLTDWNPLRLVFGPWQTVESADAEADPDDGGAEQP